MKEEKKPKSRTFFRIGFCLFLAAVFLTASLQTAAQDNPVFTGNPRFFNHDGNDNSLFNMGYMSRIDMTNQAQIEAQMIYKKDEKSFKNTKLKRRIKK